MQATPHPSPPEGGTIAARLAALPVFRSLPAEARADLALAFEWCTLQGGRVLFEQDSAPDALYVLVAGRLAARRRLADGRVAMVGTITGGECVGETGLIANAPRNATVLAVRDCELLRLPREGFERLLGQHPQAMLGLARSALRRYAEVAHSPSRPRTFALLPAQAGVPLRAVGEALQRELARFGRSALLDADSAHGRSPAFFAERESELEHLILLGDMDPNWRLQCVRQCDGVLLLADAAHPARDPGLPPPVGSPHRQLLLHHGGRVQRGSVAAWREAWPEFGTAHHLRDLADLPRVARLIAGRATTLVLSGGGARGFAHLGVLRALREAGIAIDAVAGTSIGAIIGAGLAADWPQDRLADAMGQAFVRHRPISDWTLPLVALTRGRRASRLLQEVYGERDIQDLVRPYFCVSSDLSSGELVVHEQGPLWLALRASTAIPGLLPPVFTRERILVDGGVIDNLPVAEMHRRQRGACLAVDVSGGFPPRSALEEHHLPAWWEQLAGLFGQRQRPGIGQLLLRAGMLNSDAARHRRRRQAACLLEPPLAGIELLAWKAHARAEAIGYRHAMDRMEGIVTALEAVRSAD